MEISDDGEVVNIVWLLCWSKSFADNKGDSIESQTQRLARSLMQRSGAVNPPSSLCAELPILMGTTSTGHALW